MMRRRRTTVLLAPIAVTAASAAVLATAPPSTAADNTGGFHASWFREYAETSQKSSAATVTVPTARCSGASGSALRLEYGISGRKIDQAAAAHGRITVTCGGTTPTYTASIRVDYRDSGAGSFAVAPGDTIGITSGTGSSGASVSVTSHRTGQQLRYTGPGLVTHGTTVTAELRNAPRFTPVVFSDATVDGQPYGDPRPTRWSQTDDSGRVIAEPTEFTDGGRTTTIVDRR